MVHRLTFQLFGDMPVNFRHRCGSRARPGLFSPRNASLRRPRTASTVFLSSGQRQATRVLQSFGGDDNVVKHSDLRKRRLVLCIS